MDESTLNQTHENRLNVRLSTTEAGRYPLVLRFIDGHVVVTCADFKFPIPPVRRVDLTNPDLKAIGEAVYLAHLQIEREIKDLRAKNDEIPPPSSPHDAVPRLPKAMSLREACEIMGLKEHSVRALADGGLIKTLRTKGKHRRFLRESVENYLKSASTESQGPKLSR